MKWLLDWISLNKGTFVGLVIGLAIAILFLTIGFWQTVLIAACTGVGAFLGGRADARAAIGHFFRDMVTGGKGKNADG